MDASPGAGVGEGNGAGVTVGDGVTTGAAGGVPIGKGVGAGVGMGNPTKAGRGCAITITGNNPANNSKLITTNIFFMIHYPLSVSFDVDYTRFYICRNYVSPGFDFQKMGATCLPIIPKKADKILKT